MQNSQPHMTLYRAELFLVWGGRIDHSAESLMMILLSASLASLSPTYSGGLTVLLLSSQTDIFSKNFGTNCGLE